MFSYVRKCLARVMGGGFAKKAEREFTPKPKGRQRKPVRGGGRTSDEPKYNVRDERRGMVVGRNAGKESGTRERGEGNREQKEALRAGWQAVREVSKSSDHELRGTRGKTGTQDFGEGQGAGRTESKW